MRSRTALLGVALAGATLLLAGCSQPPVSGDFELAGPVSNPEMPLPDGAAASLRDVTADVCTQEVPCVEAWASDVGLFLRFADIDDAETYHDEADDSEWDRYVVLDFSNVSISTSQRNEVTGVLLAQLPPEHAPFMF